MSQGSVHAFEFKMNVIKRKVLLEFFVFFNLLYCLFYGLVIHVNSQRHIVSRDKVTVSNKQIHFFWY
jgi:hypothetical protein